METPHLPLSRSNHRSGRRPTPASAPVRADAAPELLTDETPDEMLMHAYVQGSNAAFDRLYARYRGPLYRVLLRLLPRRDLADEVFQDTWLRMVSHRESWRADVPFRAWLLRIARNRAIDTLRQTRPETMGEAAEFWLESAVASDPGPEAAASGTQTAAQLEQALAALPGSQREAFLLRAELGLGHEEIGELTGVGTETAKSRLRYAYARLRELLSP